MKTELQCFNTNKNSTIVLKFRIFSTHFFTGADFGKTCTLSFVKNIESAK